MNSSQNASFGASLAHLLGQQRRLLLVGWLTKADMVRYRNPGQEKNREDRSSLCSVMLGMYDLLLYCITSPVSGKFQAILYTGNMIL